mmetsp:Transcript_16184/g.40948  ORF Transcript_16184/g.40948 Transcript_16184/m.40948 type:complete len:118 (-) Transcript_16184:431-784(-)
MVEGRTKIKTKTYVVEIEEERYFFQIRKMKGSTRVWIGDSSGSFKALNVAVNTPYSTVPVCSDLLPMKEGEEAAAFAQRLCKKFGETFYVSYSAHFSSPSRRLAVEKGVFSAISATM